MLRGGKSSSWCFCEVDHLEDAYALPCVKLKGLRPVIVHGIPELWTTGERRYAGHKKPGERHQGKKGRPQMGRGCDTSQGELSRKECLLFGAAERS